MLHLLWLLLVVCTFQQASLIIVHIENLHGSFLKLGPQRGINKGRSPITLNIFNTNMKNDFIPKLYFYVYICLLHYYKILFVP
jgi:hypothetical protein